MILAVLFIRRDENKWKAQNVERVYRGRRTLLPDVAWLLRGGNRGGRSRGVFRSLSLLNWKAERDLRSRTVGFDLHRSLEWMNALPHAANTHASALRLN